MFQVGWSSSSAPFDQRFAHREHQLRPSQDGSTSRTSPSRPGDFDGDVALGGLGEARSRTKRSPPGGTASMRRASGAASRRRARAASRRRSGNRRSTGSGAWPPPRRRRRRRRRRCWCSPPSRAAGPRRDAAAEPRRPDVSRTNPRFRAPRSGRRRGPRNAADARHLRSYADGFHAPMSCVSRLSEHRVAVSAIADRRERLATRLRQSTSRRVAPVSRAGRWRNAQGVEGRRRCRRNGVSIALLDALRPRGALHRRRWPRAGPREQAKRMHDRLAGVPPTAAVLDAMAADIAGGRAASTPPTRRWSTAPSTT